NCEKDYVSFANKFPAPSLGDEVNALGSTARENNFLCVRGADVFRDTPSRFFVSFSRARTQRMQPAMDIRVVVLVKIPKGFDHRARFLRSRGAIKIDQRMPVRPFAENRKILAKSIPIHTLCSKFVHTIICSTRRRAPPLFEAVKVERVVPRHAVGRRGDRRRLNALAKNPALPLMFAPSEVA